MDVITFPENRLTTSGLQILLHCVISLPDATSYDKLHFQISASSKDGSFPLHGHDNHHSNAHAIVT